MSRQPCMQNIIGVDDYLSNWASLQITLLVVNRASGEQAIGLEHTFRVDALNEEVT